MKFSSLFFFLLVIFQFNYSNAAGTDKSTKYFPFKKSGDEFVVVAEEPSNKKSILKMNVDEMAGLERKGNLDSTYLNSGIDYVAAANSNKSVKDYADGQIILNLKADLEKQKKIFEDYKKDQAKLQSDLNSQITKKMAVALTTLFNDPAMCEEVKKCEGHLNAKSVLKLISDVDSSRSFKSTTRKGVQ